MEQEYKLERTQFFVEATDSERFFLWEENHEKVEWEEDNMGFYRLVGTVKSELDNYETLLPVYVNFSFAKIGGKYICFYYGTSRGIDHDMIENYIEKYPVKWDGGTRRAMTDSMNFHHCLDFIENENRQ